MGKGEVMSKVQYDSFVCYKCEANEVSAPVGTVHPQCEACQEDFDDWFTRQLTTMKGNES
jgi:hypothetical protein